VTRAVRPQAVRSFELTVKLLQVQHFRECGHLVNDHVGFGLSHGLANGGFI
jgi:hypothetical protein